MAQRGVGRYAFCLTGGGGSSQKDGVQNATGPSVKKLASVYKLAYCCPPCNSWIRPTAPLLCDNQLI